MIFAIDPGSSESAYVVIDNIGSCPKVFGKVDNEKLTEIIKEFPDCDMVIEMTTSYGGVLNRTVWDTAVWIGRFWQAAVDSASQDIKITTMYRSTVRTHHCHSTKANDAAVSSALRDRFGGVRSVKNPNGFFPSNRTSDWKADVWQAYALGVAYCDRESGYTYDPSDEIPFSEEPESIEEAWTDLGRPE